ncbi:hypothetical protein BH23VER1_BH23VER1_31420 [soil metagenome]
MKEKLLIGLPELASQHGEMVDHMMLVVTYFMAVLFIFWSCFLGYVLYRFHHRRSPKGNYHGIRSHWSSHIEIGVVIVEAILLLGFAFPLWALRTSDFPVGNDVVRLRAVGEQFAWHFHYPGQDGVFGRVDKFLISPQNVLGLDPDDPNAADDVISKFDMSIPVRRDIVVSVTSKDVIHSLAIHSMRIQQDAIPGIDAHIWFNATKTGEWDIICSQLCGVGHSSMAAMLNVRTDEEFDEWLRNQPTFMLKQEAAPDPEPAQPPVAVADAE